MTTDNHARAEAGRAQRPPLAPKMYGVRYFLSGKAGRGWWAEAFESQQVRDEKLTVYKREGWPCTPFTIPAELPSEREGGRG